MLEMAFEFFRVLGHLGHLDAILPLSPKQILCRYFYLMFGNLKYAPLQILLLNITTTQLPIFLAIWYTYFFQKMFHPHH